MTARPYVPELREPEGFDPSDWAPLPEAKRLSDEAWSRIIEAGLLLGVSEENRARIERAFALYRYFEARKSEGRTRRDLEDALKEAAKLATKLAQKLAPSDVAFAMVPPPRPRPLTSRPQRPQLSYANGLAPSELLNRLNIIRHELKVLPAWLEQARSTVRNRDGGYSPGKKNSKANRIGFIQDLDVIFDGKMTKSNRWCDFLKVIYEIAGCKVGSEVIVKDLATLPEWRGTLHRPKTR
jgi:hypothetical protein